MIISQNQAPLEGNLSMYVQQTDLRLRVILPNLSDYKLLFYNVVNADSQKQSDRDGKT
jgi:hypothetical protein